jgi:hypothetical protein
MIRARDVLRTAVLLLTCPGLTMAQETPAASLPTTLTLDQAIQYATDHYPTVR